MELYFKDLISEEASLDKLAEDLELVAHGADDFARAVAIHLSEQSGREVAHRAVRLKESCHKLKEQVVAGAYATDHLVRTRPYSSLLVIFALGLLVGAKVLRGK